MSSDFYFNKWINTIARLESLTEFDLKYQETKFHDKQRCIAAQRLSGVLGRYIACYNDGLECLRHNVQVQKTGYIADVVKAIEARIHELKEQLRKLDGAYYQFLSNGLIDQKLTPDDAEFSDVHVKYERPDEISEAVIKALQKAKEIKDGEGKEKEDSLDFEDTEAKKWWKETLEIKREFRKTLDMTKVYAVEEKISEGTLLRKQKVALILAHEKTRQVTLMVIRQKQKREQWTKELHGTLIPPARLELRERGAKLIQKCLRFYFELKRKKHEDCKRDELLQILIRLCGKPSYESKLKNNEIKSMKLKLYKQYEDQRKVYCEEFKKRYHERKRDDIAEDLKDYIRDWFQTWYHAKTSMYPTHEVKFFYDIPKENLGGSALILKEEIPSPAEWKEKYEAYLRSKKSQKNKSALQIKYEKQAAKEEELMLKRQELKKKKLEADLLRKMLKNPTLHPGYRYPASEKTAPLQQAIKNYNQVWYDLDIKRNSMAKEKFIKNIDEERICMEVKLEINKTVDAEMRNELRQLKRALREDFKRNEEEMPETLKEKTRRNKNKRKRQGKIPKINEDIYDKLSDLAAIGILKEYPRKEFAEFFGDPNFAGDSLRCMLRPASNFGAETRSVWWELCRGVGHGSKRVLLVGAEGSGKSTLVHIMASVNDAILYEVDPSKVPGDNQNEEYLQELINSIGVCASATRPSVIYIKDVHRFYYRKVPAIEIDDNLDLMRQFFIRKMFRKIRHQNHVTVIGTCINPWLTKSTPMLKKFPTVILLPHTNYSAVFMILSNWVKNNRIVPPDLDIHSLAHVLRGYPFSYLVKTLDDFLTLDRIIKIAAYGLTPQTIYEYILSNENLTKIEYQKWYSEKTRWGKIERKRLEEDQQFRTMVEKWSEKMQKKKRDQK